MNDSSATERGATVADLGVEICSVDYRGVTFDIHEANGLVWAVNEYGSPYFCINRLSLEIAIKAAFGAIDFWYRPAPAAPSPTAKEDERR